MDLSAVLGLSQPQEQPSIQENHLVQTHANLHEPLKEEDERSLLETHANLFQDTSDQELRKIAKPIQQQQKVQQPLASAPIQREELSIKKYDITPEDCLEIENRLQTNDSDGLYEEIPPEKFAAVMQYIHRNSFSAEIAPCLKKAIEVKEWKDFPKDREPYSNVSKKAYDAIRTLIILSGDES